MPLPAGVVRIPLSKAAAETRGQELIDAAADLPDAPKPSDIIVASSLAGVDQAAQSVNQFTKRA